LHQDVEDEEEEEDEEDSEDADLDEEGGQLRQKVALPAVKSTWLVCCCRGWRRGWQGQAEPL
jgi:hypothetical protein